MSYSLMYFIDQVMCTKSECSKHESKLYSFLQSIIFLDDQNDAKSLTISLMCEVNRTSC